MRARGCAVIIITHKLNEVMAISDRVTILRKSKSIDTVATREVNAARLTELMVGHAVTLSIRRPEPQNVSTILKGGGPDRGPPRRQPWPGRCEL